MTQWRRQGSSSAYEPDEIDAFRAAGKPVSLVWSSEAALLRGLPDHLVAARQQAKTIKPKPVRARQRFMGKGMRVKARRLAQRHGGGRQSDEAEAAGKIVQQARSFGIVKAQAQHRRSAASLPRW